MGKGDSMKLKEMTIEQLKAYRAAVEVYGTASELYEVEMRIKELEGNHSRLPFLVQRKERWFLCLPMLSVRNGGRQLW